VKGRQLTSSAMAPPIFFVVLVAAAAAVATDDYDDVALVVVVVTKNIWYQKYNKYKYCLFPVNNVEISQVAQFPCAVVYTYIIFCD